MFCKSLFFKGFIAFIFFGFSCCFPKFPDSFKAEIEETMEVEDAEGINEDFQVSEDLEVGDQETSDIQDDENYGQDYQLLPISTKVDHTVRTVIKGKLSEGILFEVDVPAFAFDEDVEIMIKTTQWSDNVMQIALPIELISTPVDIVVEPYFNLQKAAKFKVQIQIASDRVLGLLHLNDDGYFEWLMLEKQENGWWITEINSFSVFGLGSAVGCAMEAMKAFIYEMTIDNPLKLGATSQISVQMEKGLLEPAYKAHIKSAILGLDKIFSVTTDNQLFEFSVEPLYKGRGAVEIYNCENACAGEGGFEALSFFQEIVIEGNPNGLSQSYADEYKPQFKFSAEEDYFPVAIEATMVAGPWLKKITDCVFDALNPFYPFLIPLSQSNFASEMGKHADNSYLLFYPSILIDIIYSVQANNPAVYWTSTRCDNNSYAIQYWLYYFRDSKVAGMGGHPGDWEVVTVFFNSNKNPISVSFSQHDGQKTMSWSEAEKIDSNHPVVYVAKGSHANYPQKVLEWFDWASGDGEVYFENYEPKELPRMSQIDSQSNFAWLLFSGTWFALENLPIGPRMPPFNGPADKWLDPCKWAGVSPPECESKAYLQCCGDDLCWYDSCGNKEKIAKYCSYGCQNDECLNETSCVFSCSKGQKECFPPSFYKVCQKIEDCWQWSDYYLQCPAGQICKNGECVCQPQCQDKECGDDGCGNSCGKCPSGKVCQNGKCVATCTPKTCLQLGKECGSWSDGCGGTINCGQCSSGYFCNNGKCLCQPNCTGKECGSDGCGGSCGICSGGYYCDSFGKCKSNCVPSCAGKECGSDGCGGSCGTCQIGYKCKNGKCEYVCQPDCNGKECGPDGCGSICLPGCSAGTSCNSEGKCIPYCVSDTDCDYEGKQICDVDGKTLKICKVVELFCYKWNKIICPEGFKCEDKNCKPICECSDWQSSGCGKNGCKCDQFYQVRDCNPDGCDIESQCVFSDNCVTSCIPDSGIVTIKPNGSCYFSDTIVASVGEQCIDSSWDLRVGMENSCSDQKAKFRTYIRFSLLCDVPKDAKIEKAVLMLRNPGSGCGVLCSGNYGFCPEYPLDLTLQFYRIIEGWGEGINWFDQPQSTFSGITQKVDFYIDGWCKWNDLQAEEFDITSLVQYWYNYPSENYGLMIKAQEEDIFNDCCYNAIGWSSSEGTNGEWPRLQIYYTKQ